MKKNITLLLRNIRFILTEKQGIVTLSSGIITLGFITLISAFVPSFVSALSYQNNVDISFTFNPIISIAVSDDLSIDNLSPGNYSDSNEITIVSVTNNLAGYTLYATVGDNTHSNPSYNNTNLNHPNGTNTFASISTNKASLSNFDENSNTWGYSYCIATNDCTNSTYWISGDYDSNNGNPSTGYNGLPLYTTVNGVKLVDTASNVGTSTIKFKIGARAANTQIAGTYTNVINFTAITKILTTNYTITYNDTTTEATGMPTSQSDTITANTNVTLSSTEPTRDGYNFAGWCTVDNSSDPTTCSGTTYQAGDAYMISNTGGSVTVPLYAVWESATVEETWYFDELPAYCYDSNETIIYSIIFSSNSENFTSLSRRFNSFGCAIKYGSIDVTTIELVSGDPGEPMHPQLVWIDQAYRTITITGGEDFDNADFRSWLSANATQL